MLFTHLSRIEAILGSVVLVLMMTPPIIALASQYNWFASQDFRRKQGHSIPLLGGAGVYLACVIMWSIIRPEGFHITLLASLPLIIIGIYDDIKEFSPRLKFASQILAVAIWLYLTPSENFITRQLGLNPWLTYMVLMFWVVGVINAMNMIDGMDGEASGIAIIAALSLALLMSPTEAIPLCIFMGACFGFLLFNFPPANIYLGESGSTFLGFFLASQAATLNIPVTSNSMVLVPLFILAVPEVDAIMAIFRRRFSNSSPLKGDHDHIHHKLQKLNFSVKQSLLIIYGAAIYAGLTAMTIYKLQGNPWVWSVAALSTLGLLTLLGSILYLEHRQAFQVSRFSKTILHRFLPKTLLFTFDEHNFEAVVYDLFPYYKELQHRGVGEVQDFIKDFSNFISQQHPDSFLQIAGSYSVIVVKSHFKFPKSQKEALCNDYYKLLAKHKVQKNIDATPRGMSFHSSKTNGKEFIRKFHLEKFTETQVHLKRVS